VHFAPEHFERDPAFAAQHEDAELLLESYLNELSAVSNGLETVEHSIDSSERFVTQRLSTQRNGLLRLDVTFTVLTASISFCSLVTGAFGMNLGSGLEAKGAPFPFVAICCALLLLLSATALLMARAPQVLYALHAGSAKVEPADAAFGGSLAHLERRLSLLRVGGRAPSPPGLASPARLGGRVGGGVAALVRGMLGAGRAAAPGHAAASAARSKGSAYSFAPSASGSAGGRPPPPHWVCTPPSARPLAVPHGLEAV
jgi:hypothetical protein